MRYENIDLLDKRIETIITRNVKHYYTDWKNYDRPKYMNCKGSNDLSDKKLILIARDCGTYLVKLSDLETGNNWAVTLIDYYTTQDPSKFFYIDLIKLECLQVKDNQVRTFAKLKAI